MSYRLKSTGPRHSSNFYQHYTINYKISNDRYSVYKILFGKFEQVDHSRHTCVFSIFTSLVKLQGLTLYYQDSSVVHNSLITAQAKAVYKTIRRPLLSDPSV